MSAEEYLKEIVKKVEIHDTKFREFDEEQKNKLFKLLDENSAKLTAELQDLREQERKNIKEIEHAMKAKGREKKASGKQEVMNKLLTMVEEQRAKERTAEETLRSANSLAAIAAAHEFEKEFRERFEKYMKLPTQGELDTELAQARDRESKARQELIEAINEVAEKMKRQDRQAIETLQAKDFQAKDDLRRDFTNRLTDILEQFRIRESDALDKLKRRETERGEKFRDELQMVVKDCYERHKRKETDFESAYGRNESTDAAKRIQALKKKQEELLQNLTKTLAEFEEKEKTYFNEECEKVRQAFFTQLSEFFGHLEDDRRPTDSQLERKGSKFGELLAYVKEKDLEYHQAFIAKYKELNAKFRATFLSQAAKTLHAKGEGEGEHSERKKKKDKKKKRDKDRKKKKESTKDADEAEGKKEDEDDRSDRSDRSEKKAGPYSPEAIKNILERKEKKHKSHEKEEESGRKGGPTPVAATAEHIKNILMGKKEKAPKPAEEEKEQTTEKKTTTATAELGTSPEAIKNILERKEKKEKEKKKDKHK